MEYYENEHGEIAVLVSHDFGAGWSTWNTKELAYDKRVVEFWLKHKDDEKFMNTVAERGGFGCVQSEANKEATNFFESIGYGRLYLGGFKDIYLVWVPKGLPFKITEYDGRESIELGYSGYTIIN